MKLTDKITSLDQFLSATYRHRDDPEGLERGAVRDDFFYSSTTNPHFIGTGGRAVTWRDPATQAAGGAAVVAPNITDRIPQDMWWLAREALRCAFVYPEASSVLVALNQNHLTCHMAVHVCPADPTLIEFTPDAEAGVKDKQLRMALGRFLVKYLPGIPSKYVQQLESMHRAEMSDECEFIEANQIAAAYLLANDSGVGACMSKGHHEYGLPEGVTPPMAYDMPGFRLAVLRKPGSQQLSARSLVWENPSDPNDKRYIRVYGDMTLKRRLERKGYKLGNLAGAKLKLIPIGTSSTRVVVPYIDGPGGAQSSYDGRYVIRRGDHIQVLTRAAAEKLNSALAHRYDSHPAKLASNAGGTMDLVTVPDDATQYTCAVTGTKTDALEVPPRWYWDGTRPVEVNPMAVMQTRAAREAVVCLTEDMELPEQLSEGTFTMLVAQDVPVFEAPSWSAYPFVDSVAAREYCGMFRLDATQYPEDQGWKTSAEAVNGDTLYRLGRRLVVTDQDGKSVYSVTEESWFNADDLQRLVVGGIIRWVLKSTVPATAVRVADHEGEKLYAASMDEVVLTDTKRKVVPGVHDVVKLYNGTYTYSRNAQRISLFGHRFYVRQSDGLMPRLESLPEELRQNVADAVHDSSVSDTIRYYLRRVTVLSAVPAEQRLRLTDGYSHTAESVQVELDLLRTLESRDTDGVIELYPATSRGLAAYASNLAHNLALIRAAAEEAAAAMPAPAVRTVDGQPLPAGAPAVTPSGFSVDDQVEIIQRTRYHTRDGQPAEWHDVWVGAMDDRIGTTGRITADEGTHGLRVRFDDGMSYTFPTGALRLATAQTLAA